MTPTTAFPMMRHPQRAAAVWMVLLGFALWVSAGAALWRSAALWPSVLPALTAQQHAEVANASAPPAPLSARLGPATSSRHAAVLPAALAWQLRDSDDLMDYIERARFDPASGGFYYALKAYDFCAREAKVSGHLPRLEDLLLTDGPVPDIRKLSAALRIAALCRGFVQPQALPFSYISLTEEGQTLGDPKLALSQRLERLSAATAQSEEFSDPAARATMLNALLATRDPWLLRDLAAELRLIEAKITLVIDGAALVPEEHPAFFAAFNLAACELGAPCSADNDWYQLLACSGAGTCDAPQAAANNDPLHAAPYDPRSHSLQQKIRYRLLHAASGWLDFVPRQVP